MMIPNFLRLRSECEAVPFTEMGKVEERTDLREILRAAFLIPYV